MAQKISIQLIDDIDGSEASESVSFALDGQSYTIDLSIYNAQAIRQALAPYVANATRASRVNRGPRNRSARGSGASEIRAWARGEGYQVPDRGRVSAEIKAAYEAAH